MNTTRMPLLFIGHGSPMNAIEDNAFTQMLAALSPTLPRPKAILIISAHWVSQGTWVTGMAKPRTIHDFHGFPAPLFDIQYPAPGNPKIAELVQQMITSPPIHNDLATWGIDHGSWSVLRHLYPHADIPVVQMSIDIAQPPEYHFQIGQQLAPLRDQGVLIIGSGNLVHNLAKINWQANATPYDWAHEFDAWTKQKLESRDFNALLHDVDKTAAGKLSVPSMEHYYPLHYILGAADAKDELRFEFEEIHLASIAMRTFTFLPKDLA